MIDTHDVHWRVADIIATAGIPAPLIVSCIDSQRRFDFGPNPPISIRFAARSDPVDFTS
jgi:hypothetical protein